MKLLKILTSQLPSGIPYWVSKLDYEDYLEEPLFLDEDDKSAPEYKVFVKNTDYYKYTCKLKEIL